MSSEPKDVQHHLEYRGTVSRERGKERSRYFTFAILALLVSIAHLVGSHLILFNIRKPPFSIPGPAGPEPTMLIGVFEFPLYPQYADVQSVWDLGKWNDSFFEAALGNAVLWGVASFGCLVATRALLARPCRALLTWMDEF